MGMRHNGNNKRFNLIKINYGLCAREQNGFLSVVIEMRAHCARTTARSSTWSRELKSKKCISHSGAERIFVLSIITWYRIAQNERMPGSRNTHRAACIIHSLHFS